MTIITIINNNLFDYVTNKKLCVGLEIMLIKKGNLPEYVWEGLLVNMISVWKGLQKIAHSSLFCILEIVKKSYSVIYISLTVG